MGHATTGDDADADADADDDADADAEDDDVKKDLLFFGTNLTFKIWTNLLSQH